MSKWSSENESSRMDPQRTAIGAAVIALVVVAIMAAAGAVYFSATNLGGSRQTPQTVTSPTSRSITSIITVTAGQPQCGLDSELVDSNSNGSLYVSANPRVGDNVCITGSLNYSDEVYLSVTNSAGILVFSPGACVAGGYVGGGEGDTCTAHWDTSQLDLHGTPIEPGIYHLMASDSQGAPVALEGNFTLS
jgi:hypothetical protein